MSYQTLLFDLDDTLYSSSTGIWDRIGDRINLYIQEKIGYSPEDVSTLRDHLFHKYGTTLRGLQIEYGVEAVDYLDFVHQVPIENMIGPDPQLNLLLNNIHQPKWIFTNASRDHALRVLYSLQIGAVFQGIIDILDIAPYCKPMPEAFEMALQKAGICEASSCILIDDSPRNLSAGRQLGMFTIQVGSQTHTDAHVQIATIHELPAILPPGFLEV